MTQGTGRKTKRQPLPSERSYYYLDDAGRKVYILDVVDMFLLHRDHQIFSERNTVRGNRGTRS